MKCSPTASAEVFTLVIASSECGPLAIAVVELTTPRSIDSRMPRVTAGS
ncbi:MAG: hypothetical protein QM723_21955 [Myxococcaceae bacterium]